MEKLIYKEELVIKENSNLYTVNLTTYGNDRQIGEILITPSNNKVEEFESNFVKYKNAEDFFNKKWNK